MEDAKEDYNQFDKFTSCKPVKKLVISGEYTSISSEARNIIQQENKKRKDKIIAEALVVNSLGSKLLATYYYKIIGTSYPIKIFTTTSKAKAWLSSIDE